MYSGSLILCILFVVLVNDEQVYNIKQILCMILASHSDGMNSSVFWDITVAEYCCSNGDYHLVTDNEGLQMHFCNN
jgi:hypothetical protein